MKYFPLAFAIVRSCHYFEIFSRATKNRLSYSVGRCIFYDLSLKRAVVKLAKY